jgi:hypothetical protein
MGHSIARAIHVLSLTLGLKQSDVRKNNVIPLGICTDCWQIWLNYTVGACHCLHQALNCLALILVKCGATVAETPELARKTRRDVAVINFVSAH